MAQQVCSGATLQCRFGMAPSTSWYCQSCPRTKVDLYLEGAPANKPLGLRSSDVPANTARLALSVRRGLAGFEVRTT
jgi:hypothetical protein